MSTGNKVELVAPAGDWSALKSAVSSGADSVYFGIKGINMRQGAKNFDLLEIGKIMSFLKKNKVNGYLALNTIAYEKELPKIEKILIKAKKEGVDAVILWDAGILSMAKEIGHNIHISTQASISNTRALKHFASFGARRAVLAREVALCDIEKIIKSSKKQKINIGIETFIHGAMCVSVSGRCFLSQETFSKSANRGECRQPCRRKYKIKDIGDESEYILGENYLLSPKDICSIMFIDKLIDAGISAFKIEGRMRSSEYVKEVTAVYRKAIDLYYEGKLTKKVKTELYKYLKKFYNRGFHEGFYLGEPENWITEGLHHENVKDYIGEVIKYYKKIEVAEIMVKKGEINKGDKILISGDKTPAFFVTAIEMEKEHISIEKAAKGERIALKLPEPARKGDKVFTWLPRS